MGATVQSFLRIWRPLVIGVSLVLVLIAFRFRDVGYELLAELEHSSVPEVSVKLEFLSYFLSYVSKLTPSKNGLYDFWRALNEANVEGTSAQIGVLAFHQGQIDEAINQLVKERRSLDEEEMLWLSVSLMHAYTQGDHRTGDDRRRILLQLRGVIRELLDKYGQESGLYRWLYTLSYLLEGLTVGDVPVRYQISPASPLRRLGINEPAQERRGVAFVERAESLGVEFPRNGKGVAAEDFNNDGYLDLVVADSFGATRYLQNIAGKRFVDRTATSGLLSVTQVYSVVAVDYDNDGLLDLFLTRPFHHYHLMRNVGGAHFEDVTFSSGLLETPDLTNRFYGTWHSAWGDVDSDGDLDLFLSQWGKAVPGGGGIFAKDPVSSQLFLNEDGRFVDATSTFRLTSIVEDQNFVSGAFGDYDRDGDPDLFLSSFSSGKSTLLNNVNGQYFERTKLIARAEPGFMSAFVDLNQDGLLDLVQGSNVPAKSALRNIAMDLDLERYTQAIFLQSKSGSFERRDNLFENQIPLTVLGMAFGDLNNDGCSDFYFGTGNPEPWYLTPNILYVSSQEDSACKGGYSSVGQGAIVGIYQQGQGAVMFDFDNDGDQDLFAVNGGMWPVGAWKNQLLVNETEGNGSWVRFRLRGSQSNYFGVGAPISVFARNMSGEQVVRHTVISNKSGYGSAPYIAHIGLGNAVSVDYAEVFWPGSKTSIRYKVALGKMTLLEEGGGLQILG